MGGRRQKLPVRLHIHNIFLLPRKSCLLIMQTVMGVRKFWKKENFKGPEHAMLFSLYSSLSQDRQVHLSPFRFLDGSISLLFQVISCLTKAVIKKNGLRHFRNCLVFVVDLKQKKKVFFLLFDKLFGDRPTAWRDWFVFVIYLIFCLVCSLRRIGVIFNFFFLFD